MAPGQLHEGWLSVGGERFYFVLYDDYLARFRTEEDARSGNNGEKLDFDNVEDVDVIGSDENTSVKFTFSDKTTWECKADSQQDMEQWLDALEPIFGDDGEAPQEPPQRSAVEADQSTNTDFAVPKLDLSMPVGSAGHTQSPDSAVQGAAPAPAGAPSSTAAPAPTDEPAPARAPSYPRLPAASTVSTAAVGDVAETAAPALANASATSPEAPAATTPAGAAPAAPKAASGTPATAPDFSPAPRKSGEKLASPAHVGGDDDAAASLAFPVVAPVRTPAAPVAVVAPAAKKTASVKLTVVGATGPLFAKAAPEGRWVTCEVPSKFGQVFRTTTRSQAKPQWNHDMVIRNYQWSDMLHLSVVHNHEIIGSCDVQTSSFHPKAFDGTFDLLDDTQTKLKNCKLKLRISGKDLDSLKAPVKQVQEAAREGEEIPLPTVLEEAVQIIERRTLLEGDDDEDENSPSAMVKPFSQATRGPRGGVRLKGTVYAGGSDDGQLSSRSSMKSRTPVSSVVDESSDREEAPAEDDDQANQTFNAARYRGKYHHMSTRLQFQGQDEKTALLNSMSPKLMWVVEGKAVKKWESQSVIHKQITLQGLMAQSPNVRVNIVRMRGRRAGNWKLRWDGECRCHVRNPAGQVSTKFSTGIREDLASTLSTTAWNHESEVVLDSNRDSLEFTIQGVCKDASPKTEAVLGKARLSSARFLAAGFNGDIRIESQESVEAYLHVVVAVLRIWDENLNMEIPPAQAATILKRASPADASILAPGKGWSSKLPVKARKPVKVTTHDMLHFDATRRNLDRELQGKMVHQTMTTPFRKRRWMWDEVDNVLMREVYGAPRENCQPLASASETIATAVTRPPGPRLEFSTAHVFEEGDAELACVGPALDRSKHYLCLNEDFSEGSSEDFDNNAVETSSESADEPDPIGKENNRGDSMGMGQANNVGNLSKSQFGDQSVSSNLPLDSKHKLPAVVEAVSEEWEKDLEGEKVPLILLVSDDSNQARVYLKQQGVGGSGDPKYCDLTEVAGACGIRPDDLTIVGENQLSRESVDKMMGAVNRMKEQRPSLKFLTATTKSVPTAACKKGSAWATPVGGMPQRPMQAEEGKEQKTQELVNQPGRSGGDDDDANKSRSFFGFGKAKPESPGKEQSKKRTFLPFRGKSEKANEKKGTTADENQLSPKQGKGMMSKIGGFMRGSKKNPADMVQDEQDENEEEEEEEQEEEDEHDEEESADDEEHEKREEPVSAPVAEGDDEGEVSQYQMVQAQQVKKKTVINLFEDVVEISGGRSSDEEASEREQAAILIQKKQRQLFAKAEFERRRQEALASQRDRMKKDKKDKLGKHDDEADKNINAKVHKEKGHRHGKHKHEHKHENKHHKPKEDAATHINLDKKKGKDDESPRRDSLHRLEPAPHHFAEPPGGQFEEHLSDGWELARFRVPAMTKESEDPSQLRQSFRSAQPRIDTGLRKSTSRKMP